MIIQKSSRGKESSKFLGVILETNILLRLGWQDSNHEVFQAADTLQALGNTCQGSVCNKYCFLKSVVVVVVVVQFANVHRHNFQKVICVHANIIIITVYRSLYNILLGKFNYDISEVLRHFLSLQRFDFFTISRILER